MNQYTYKIVNLTCNLKKENMPNYVTGVGLNAYAIDDLGHETSLYFYGHVENPSQDPTNFIPFDSLTEETVIQWLEAAGLLNGVREQLDQDLLRQIDPVIKDMVPPWIPPPAPPAPPPDPIPTEEAVALPIPTAQFNEEYIRAMVYQVLEEIEASKI